ncbi:LSU ribosomal protein L9p [hydrothermal vent metagenome]|uniref:LSU ribosomal protein L9p n=1 Tax=hydrothermal vent metagenome TaxID=652676 RepID=A0A3B1DLF4_9ZZZZ
MEVILSEEVQKLGKIGQVVSVKDGYARNYLVPNKLAYLATPANLKRIELQQKKKQAQYEQEKKAARNLAQKLSKVSCTVNVAVNDLDKLYGSVTENEIIKALEVEGHTIDRKDLVIEKPIDELGIFEVGIILHPEVTAKIRLWVTK